MSIFGFLVIMMVGLIPRINLTNSGWQEYIMSIAVGCKIALETLIKCADPPTLIGSIKSGLFLQDETRVKINN